MTGIGGVVGIAADVTKGSQWGNSTRSRAPRAMAQSRRFRSFGDKRDNCQVRTPKLQFKIQQHDKIAQRRAMIEMACRNRRAWR
jgi:hypothetical protein